MSIHEIEPFGEYLECSNAESQAMLEKCKYFYGKYAEQVRENKALHDKTKLLEFDVEHKVGLVQNQYKQLQLLLDREKAACHALQTDASRQPADSCPHCARHIAAGLAYKQTMSNATSNMDKLHKTSIAELEASKMKFHNELLENGDRKSTRLNSSHSGESRMPSSA